MLYTQSNKYDTWKHFVQNCYRVHLLWQMNLDSVAYAIISSKHSILFCVLQHPTKHYWSGWRLMADYEDRIFYSLKHIYTLCDFRCYCIWLDPYWTLCSLHWIMSCLLLTAAQHSLSYQHITPHEQYFRNRKLWVTRALWAHMHWS